MNSITRYSKSQDYVRDLYFATKSNDPTLTIERFAQKVGIGTSTLKMIISGKRKLTVSHAHQLSKVLKLSKTETEYFQNLVLKDRSRHQSEKKHFNENLKLVRNEARLESVPVSDKAVLKDPLLMPLVIYLYDIEEDVEKASQTLGLPKEKVEMALQILRGITQGAEKPSRHFVFSQLNHKLSQQEYLSSWMFEAQRRLKTNYLKSEDIFNVSTISVGPDDLQDLREDLKAVIEKYAQLKTKKEKIIQLCIQILHL